MILTVAPFWEWYKISRYPTSAWPDLCLDISIFPMLYDGAGNLDTPKCSHKVISLPSVMAHTYNPTS